MASKLAGNVITNVFSQIQKRFLRSSATISSSSPLPNTGSSSSFTVQFLVKECGIPMESAVSVSKKFQLDERNPQKPQSVLEFLKSHEFSDNQVAKLIVMYPSILHFNVRKNLQPKFDYYMEIGVAGKLLPQLIISSPAALRRSLDSSIKPCVEFLRSFLHSNKKIAPAILRSHWLFAVDLNGTIRLNVDFLLKVGVSSHGIGKLIWYGGVITQNPKTLVDTVNAVKHMGLQPNAALFVHALRVLASNPKSTFKKKIGFMRSIGWSKEEIFFAFKRFPYCISYSEAKISNALHFYLDTMRLEHKIVVANPVLLGLSIEKRVRPRYEILKFLESKKLIAITIHPLMISEADFRMRYVDQYIPEVPGLLEMYLGSKEAKKIDS